KSSASMGVYGEYTVRRRRYQFRIRLMDVARARIVNEVEFTLAEDDVKDRKLWRRELEPLFEGATIEPPEKPPETPPEKPDGDGSGVPELPPISTDGGTAGDGTEELPAIDSSAEAGAAGSAAEGSQEVFIDDSLLDAGSRGVIWHGFFQNYTA